MLFGGLFRLLVSLQSSACPAQQEQGIPPHILTFVSIPPQSYQTSALTDSLGNVDDEQKAENKEFQISFTIFGRQFDLELQPTDLFAEEAEHVSVDDGIEAREESTAPFYSGTVAGEPESWVRVRTQDGVMDGMIRTADEVYFKEPGTYFFTDVAVNAMVAFRLSDTSSDWEPGSCALDQPAVGAEMSQRSAFHEIPEEYASFVSELQQVMAESGTLMEAEIGLVADCELYQEHGSNTATYRQNIVNQVRGILENEAGLKLKITQTVVHTSSNDPFTGTTSPSSLLNEFASYKGNSSNPVYGTDLTHLFTNRNLDGSAIGVAWLSTSRGNYYAAGLSEDNPFDNKSMVFLAGHNLASRHDNQSGSACASTSSGYVMN